jgi:hypothetical protein
MWARRNCANGWFSVPKNEDKIDEQILVFVSNTRNPEKDDGEMVGGWKTGEEASRVSRSRN